MSERPARSWTCPPTCGVCGAPNPPMRVTCSAECKRIAKRAYDVARYPSHREKKIEVACRWQEENRERKQAYDAAYRELTRERRAAQKREAAQRRRAADLEGVRLDARMRAATRYARKTGAGVFVVLPRDLRRALERAGHKCSCCGDRFTKENPLEWDHVIPIKRGGRHSIGNLAPCCRRCNRTKGRRLLIEWRLGKVVSYRAA